MTDAADRLLRVALIGDRDDAAVAHRAIPRALELAARAEGVRLSAEWVPTETVEPAPSTLSGFDGVWCVPASPYRSTAGALAAIRLARERRVPFLGTCGGFQHAILECAASLWGILDAAHSELRPDAAAAVIAPLACALIERGGEVTFAPGSTLATAYGAHRAEEEYHCSYGLGAAYRKYLDDGPLRATAWDLEGDVRGVELDGHPFFVATLFQPERAALRGAVPAVVAAFVRAVAKHAMTSMYSPSSRELQDRFDTRRLADRLAEVKVHATFTPDDRAFVERLDMFFLATVDDEGRPTCSYKGGDPGFVSVLDERSLAFPSYDGNGMFLSLGNVAATRYVGLLFIDLEEPRRMRVEGRARIELDHPLLARHPEAQLLVVVEADRIYPNCARYIHKYELVERSRFVPHADRETPVPAWKQSAWAADVLPSQAQTASGPPHRDASYFEPGPLASFDPPAVVRGCIENGKRSLLLDVDALPPSFFDLSSGVAGELLHRLGVYGIRLASVVPDPSVHSAPFQSFVLETNRGRQARFFPTRREAVEWLAS